MKIFIRRIIWIFLYYFCLKYYLKFRTRTSLLGFSLQVSPAVFHPKFSISSKFFGEFVQQLDVKNKSVLDMGTGSGIIGIVAASNGANVVALDINEEAIRCASENAKRNNLENKIKFYHSNLFSELEKTLSQKFDFIFFNPPFYPKQVTNTTQHAWNAGKDYETIQRFANEAKKYLSMDGKIYFILSSDIDRKTIGSFFEHVYRNINLRATKKLLFETFYIYEAD